MSSKYQNNKVYPSEHVSKQVVHLSICDVYSPKSWVTQTHFWSMPKETTFDQCYDILREALSRTLSEIPALAGTIVRKSSNPRDLTIEIDENSHVEFAREDLSYWEDIPNYESLRASGFPMTGLVEPFSMPDTLAPIFEGSRMITAKLNLLKGGLALSFGFNHLLADASTVAEVERIWSQHTTDVSCGEKRSHRHKVQDEAIRARLSAPVAGAGKFVDDGFKVFPTSHSQLNFSPAPIVKERRITFIEETIKAAQASSNEHDNADKANWAIWSFSAENLAKLKKDAAGLDPTKWISTMDALIGLFWSRLSYAKQASRSGHEESMLLFPINIRKRLQPSIDAKYIGNAVDIITTKHSLQELEHPDTGLASAARCVREAVSGWQESKWASWLTMAAGLPDDEAICPNPLCLLVPHNIGFNDYSNSQSNTLDWGTILGRVDRTRYMKPASSLTKCATAVIVHPRLQDGGLEVATTSTQSLKDTLEKDEVFAKYAKLVCFYS
ncbi:Acyltransferase M4 [Pseudocercospora fuligena]|uniref:Acyltransferase M4 n=1 Tax=Pseudocercospora fuligena TaxID=685502 RepID=A0A8H6VDR4_9PEZI|nr:Acyltransferase M4 [Pseudocercospora fuligena]